MSFLNSSADDERDKKNRRPRSRRRSPASPETSRTPPNNHINHHELSASFEELQPPRRPAPRISLPQQSATHHRLSDVPHSVQIHGSSTQKSTSSPPPPVSLEGTSEGGGGGEGNMTKTYSLEALAGLSATLPVDRRSHLAITGKQLLHAWRNNKFCDIVLKAEHSLFYAHLEVFVAFTDYFEVCTFKETQVE